jgi:sulfate transporter 4
VIIRVDAPLYFANAQNVRDKVRKYKRVATDELKERNGGEVHYIILDLTPVSHIDTTALQVLEDMYLTQKRLGVQICFCNPGIAVTERLVKSGIVDLVGREHFFSAVIDAVQWCLNDMECPSE